MLFDKKLAFVYARVDKHENSMTQQTPIRLSVSEAAKIFGISQRTVRRALTDGQIKYIVVHGRYKITFESLLKWSQSSTTVRNKMNRAGIGQFVDKWKIKNQLYSPNPDSINEKVEKAKSAKVEK